MTTYLLAIGINHYTDRAFRALSCCENDATELHSLFKRNLELGDRARKLIGAVSIADVINELRRIRLEIRNGDTFVFFFAGHGYQHPRREDQFLLFPEAEARLVNKGYLNGMLSLSALCELTEDWAGVARVFVLDACRSWLPGRGSEEAIFDNESALAYIASRSPALGPETAHSHGNALAPVILNATRNGDQARELEHLGRGILALALERAFEKQSRAGRPIWLNSATFADIGEHMQSLLQQGQFGVTQTPFMTPTNGQILIYKPECSMPTKQPETETDSALSDNIPVEQATAVADTAFPDVAQTQEERWLAVIDASSNCDHETATALVNALVAEEYPEAIKLLADWHSHEGWNPFISIDATEAKRLYERAAALGHCDAMHTLAWKIQESAGYHRPIPDAAQAWRRQAAQGKHLPSAIELYEEVLDQADPDLQEQAQVAQWLENAMRARPHYHETTDERIVYATAFCRQDLRRLDLAEMALDNWPEVLKRLEGQSESDRRSEDNSKCKLLVLRAWLFENTSNASPEHRKDAQRIYERLNELTNGDQPRLALEGFANNTHWGHRLFERSFTQETALLRRSAEMGNPSSQFMLARELWLGNTNVSVHSPEYGSGSDEKAASELIVAAAEAGHADAMIELARAYRYGGRYGIPINLPLAEEWVCKAKALELYASQLASLASTCQDDILRVETYRRCIAKLENGGYFFRAWNVYLSLGMELWAGIGIAQDCLEAERLFEKSVALHDAEEKEHVGRQSYRIAKTFCTADPRYQDFDAARKWLIKSAEAGNQKAMLSLAGCLVNDCPHQGDIARLRGRFHNSQTYPEDKKQARYWLDRLVELGNRDAKFTLALALLRGTPFGENAKLADNLLRELEEGWREAKDHYSMLKVASAWEQTANNGFSAADKAKYWRDLAEQGAGSDAQYARAWEIANKFPDNASAEAQEAFRLMDKAARSGHFEAMKTTGIWLMRGYGTQANTQLAEQWFERYVAQRREDDDGWAADRFHVIATELFELASGAQGTLSDALRWLKKACAAGSDDGLLDFAIVCGEGIGGEKDTGMAKQLFQQWLRRTLRSEKLLNTFDSIFIWHAPLTGCSKTPATQCQ